MNSRERVLAVLHDQTPDHLALMPITMMLAARHVGIKYGTYALDHRVMVEAQIRTAEDFGFDHVSAITETREALDCGASVHYFEDQPYALDESRARLAEKGELELLKAPGPTEGTHMHDRLQGIHMMKGKIGREKMVEGWVEGPCQAAADLRGINTLMLDFYDDPGFVRNLFSFVLNLAVRFGEAQLEAGADIIGIGDPAASLVGPQFYRQYVWPYERRLVESIHAKGGWARLHICGDTRRILQDIGTLGCDIVDIDSKVPLAEARQKMGTRQLLLGGLDPVRVLQQGTPEQIWRVVAECHRQAGSRYILGAGCEVPPGTPADNLRVLSQYAQSH
jgi:MtaA/CmuA family methyltransferase